MVGSLSTIRLFGSFIELTLPAPPFFFFLFVYNSLFSSVLVCLIFLENKGDFRRSFRSFFPSPFTVFQDPRSGVRIGREGFFE